MLNILLAAERALPELLKDEDGWTGVYADAEKPHLQRLWRQWGEHRLYLHRFQGCAAADAFIHPHPWPSAVRLLKGRYEIGVGASGDPTRLPPVIFTGILEPGSCYEMPHPDGWHVVRPVDEETFSFMVAGPPIWPQNRIPANAPARVLTSTERRIMFNFFRFAYNPTTQGPSDGSRRST